MYKMTFTRDGIAKGDPEALLNWKERWPNFTPLELSSRGNGSLTINLEALDALQRLRNSWKRPLVITSAYRDEFYNAQVGGAKSSLHMQGRAFDIKVDGWNDAAVIMLIYYATKAGFNGFGIYLDRVVPFVHVDTGKPRSWQAGQSRLDDTDDVTEIGDHRV